MWFRVSCFYDFIFGIRIEEAGGTATADAIFYAFQEREIGLDTDAAVKLNRDEVEERKLKCQTTEGERGRQENQGHGVCSD